MDCVRPIARRPEATEVILWNRGAGAPEGRATALVLLSRYIGAIDRGFPGFYNASEVQEEVVG